MIMLNTRDELVEFLYGENSTEPTTLVGIARIGGELLTEAFSEPVDHGFFCITEFFPCGDEGEGITVDRNGTIVEDFLYY